jgi:hypothetical protein
MNATETSVPLLSEVHGDRFPLGGSLRSERLLSL